MDRLTYRGKTRITLAHMDMECLSGLPSEQREGLQVVLDRLAAYEDTGYTPEEIAALNAENERLKKDLTQAWCDIGTLKVLLQNERFGGNWRPESENLA